MSTITSTSTLSTTTAAAEFAHAMPSPVVQNDTPARPSIKLNALGVPASITVGNTTTAVPQNKLAVMEQARMSWETTELAASNKRLYSILKDAYSYYLVMKKNPNEETRKQHATEVDKFIAQRKYTFMPSTHDMTRVVKCVFGADRRRVSAYSIALREALRQAVAAKDLAVFIEQNGGVEQIRLGGTKPLSAKLRAGKVKDEVLSAELGLIKFDARLVGVDADWADKQVVIVATYLPTGEFQANAVIRHDSAVNAALAAYYSKQQAAIREAEKVERDAEQQRLADLKKSASKVKAAVAKKAPKSSKEEKQQAKVASEQLQAKRDAANKAHANSLFEQELA